MFSKNAILSLLIVPFLLSGCIAKVGEAPPPQKAQELNGTQCMTEALPVVTRFMEGEARNEEVAAAWDCVASVIDKFSKYVGNGTSDRYTSQELATFIEKNFLDPKENPKISAQLQLEFMKIKQIFVGGSRDFVTKAELARSREVFAAFKSICLKLNPYMKVYIQDWETSKGGDLQRDMKFFEEANETSQVAARELASLISKNHQAYVISDFENLMAELSKFYGESWESVRQIHKFLPVVKKIKKAIAGGDEGTISSTEWKSFVLLGVRGYIQYLRYTYFIQSMPETGAGLRLAYIARSFEDIFSVFQDLVQEKPGGVVAKEEIEDLLFTFSREWPDFKVSSGAISEVMKLKQAMFGGSAESWSTTDFESAKLKVYRLKAIFERFLPYFTVYGMDWDPRIYEYEDGQKFFMDAQYNLEASAQELGALFEGNYRLEDLQNLVFEIEKLYPGEDGIADVSLKLNDYIPVVARFKNIAFSENDTVLRKENWSSFMRIGARVYTDYLYWNYFVKNTHKESAEGLSSLNILVQQSLNILRDILANKTGAMIHKSELTALVMDLKNADIVPEELTTASVEMFWDYTLNNILNPPAKRIAGVRLNSLTLDSVEYVRNEYLIWSEGERFANTLFMTTPSQSVDSLLAALKVVTQSPIAEEKLAGEELVRIYTTPVPFVFDAETRLLISNKVSKPVDRQSFADSNLHRAIARILMQSLAGDLGRIQQYQGFTLPEAQEAFAKLRMFFVELDMLDKGSLSFADSRFREANIFVPRSDGNNLASFEESVDLIGMLFSGVQNAKALKASLVQSCMPAGVKKLTPDTKLSVPCVRKTFYAQMSSVLVQLPEYQNFMKKTSREEWNIYFRNIVKAAGYVPNEKELMRYGEVEQIPHVIQYVEMIYNRFDKNKDGIISTPDAMRAFPAFKGLMMDLAKKDIEDGTISRADLDDVFTFILRYGHPPTSIGEKLNFVLRWKNKPDNWDVWADRVQLASILGYIADQVSASPKSSQQPSPLASAQ